MQVIHGNLITLAKQGQFDVIVHGCNCFCTMGAGIAKQIKMAFPSAYYADLDTYKGDKGKLGDYSSSLVLDGKNRLTVINAYTQWQWQGKGIKVDYDAIKKVFLRIKQDFSGARIAYPRIGAGLAGGDWSVISAIISKALEGENHTLVEFLR